MSNTVSVLLASAILWLIAFIGTRTQTGLVANPRINQIEGLYQRGGPAEVVAGKPITTDNLRYYSPPPNDRLDVPFPPRGGSLPTEEARNVQSARRLHQVQQNEPPATARKGVVTFTTLEGYLDLPHSFTATINCFGHSRSDHSNVVWIYDHKNVASPSKSQKTWYRNGLHHFKFTLKLAAVYDLSKKFTCMVYRKGNDDAAKVDIYIKR